MMLSQDLFAIFSIDKIMLSIVFSLGSIDKKLLKLTTKIVTNPENGDVKLYFAKKILLSMKLNFLNIL